MASSDFTVNTLSLPQVISVNWTDTVTCALVSAQGITGITWSIASKSRASLATPTLTPAGSPPGATMTFSVPAADAEAALGGSYLVQCAATYSVGAVSRTTITRAVVGVPMTSGVIPGAAGETTERGTYGWSDIVNLAASGSMAATSTDYLVPHAESSLFAWSTTVWSDGTFLGFASAYGDLPTLGNIRMALSGTAFVKDASGGNAQFLSFETSGASTYLHLGSSQILRGYYDMGGKHYFRIAGNEKFSIHVDHTSIDYGYLSIGSGSLPTTGDVRTEGVFSLTGYRTGVAAGAKFLSWNNTGYAVWLGEDTNVTFAVLAALTGLLFRVGGAQIASVDSDGLTVTSGKELDITGVTVKTAVQSDGGVFETFTHGDVALDAGADGSPVAIVTYTLPDLYCATVKCRVSLETNARVLAHNAEWTIVIQRDSSGGGTGERSAAVTPTGDPAASGVAVTYGYSAGVLTLYKQNTSGTAMLAHGDIVVSRWRAQGAGT